MRKKIIPLLIFMGIALIVIIIYTGNKATYGNDENSIIEIISSIGLYEGKSILLLEVYDFDDDRVVTFLSNSCPSIIEFTKNKKGNYVVPHSETRQNENLSQFIRGRIGHNDDVYVFSVKNQYSTTYEYSFRANEEMYSVDFNFGHPNSQWTQLLKSDDKSYTFEWFIPED